MKSYHHLNHQERDRLALGLARGLSLRKMGRRLGRDHRTLGRELKRNTQYGKVYLPHLAQKKAERVAQRQRYQAPLKNPEVFLYVREHLREGWSPETIAGRLKKLTRSRLSLSHEAIYRYIYQRRNRREKLWQYLTLGRKKRRKWNGRSVRRRAKILNTVPIDLRPKLVLRRRQLGHWETDNMEGLRSDRVAVSVSAERTSRLVLLSKLSSRKAEAKTRALIRRFRALPAPARLTVTADNGAENSQHQLISQTLNLGFYFCHPYHAWEKGTVENNIQRLRRYLPKGVSLEGVSEDDLQRVEERMNCTPRKCLGYLTPYEKMSILLKKVKARDSTS